MTAIAVVLGMLTGWGAWLTSTGIRRAQRPDLAAVTRWRQRLAKVGRVRMGIAAAAGLMVLVVTRWPVAALIAGLFVWAAPALLLSSRREAKAQATLDAIASYTEAIRGRLRAYAGIEQAIKEAAPLAKPPIHTQTVGLAAAIDAGIHLAGALDAFRADVNHHGADLVAVSLRLASTRRSGNLAAQLGFLAHTMRERVAARQRVETARAEAKSSARIVIIIVVAVGVGLFVFNRPLLAPYNHAGGQLVLLAVGAIWTLATIYLHRLSMLPEQERILRSGDRGQS